MTVYQQLFRKVRTHCGVELTDETEKREEFFYEKNGDDAKQDGSSAGSRHDDNDVGGRSWQVVRPHRHR